MACRTISHSYRNPAINSWAASADGDAHTLPSRMAYSVGRHKITAVEDFTCLPALMPTPFASPWPTAFGSPRRAQVHHQMGNCCSLIRWGFVSHRTAVDILPLVSPPAGGLGASQVPDTARMLFTNKPGTKCNVQSIEIQNTNAMSIVLRGHWHAPPSSPDLPS